jgi:hypothetical protein
VKLKGRSGTDSAWSRLQPGGVPRASQRRSPFSHRCLSSVAGAQSLFALTKQGRRFALASLLVKTEVGVADAWVREGMTKAEADALIAQIVADKLLRTRIAGGWFVGPEGQ